MPVCVSFSPPGLGHRPGDAEVGHERVSALEEDVLRLDVAMDDAALVGVLQRLGGLAGDAKRVVQRQLLLPVEPVPERLALDERHDVVEQAFGLSRVVQAEDVGVLEGGGDADFAEEAVAAERGGELGAEHLDGDRPLVLDVPGEEDGRHPALARLALHGVAIAQGGSESVDRFGHVSGLGAGDTMLQDKAQRKGSLGDRAPGSGRRASRTPIPIAPRGSWSGLGR